MASGHMNRVKRPDAWLHRPMLQNVKKVLANSEDLDLEAFNVSRSPQRNFASLVEIGPDPAPEVRMLC